MWLKNDNKDAQNFIKQYNNFFDLIILNTCGFQNMEYSLIHQLLKENGKMIFTYYNNYLDEIRGTGDKVVLFTDISPDRLPVNMTHYFKKIDDTTDKHIYVKI